MFVYKENRDLMRRDQINTGRNGEKLSVGSPSGSGNGNANTNNNINKISSSAEGVKQTSIDGKNKYRYDSIEKITNYDNSRKKGFPSYDVKIVGGKKVIIYHDKQKDNPSLQKPDKR